MGQPITLDDDILQYKQAELPQEIKDAMDKAFAEDNEIALLGEQHGLSRKEWYCIQTLHNKKTKERVGAIYANGKTGKELKRKAIIGAEVIDF